MPFLIHVSIPGYLPDGDPYMVENLEQARHYAKQEIERTVQAHDGPGDEDSTYSAQEAKALHEAQNLDDDGGVIHIGKYVVEVSPVSPAEFEWWKAREDFE